MNKIIFTVLITMLAFNSCQQVEYPYDSMPIVLIAQPENLNEQGFKLSLKCLRESGSSNQKVGFCFGIAPETQYANKTYPNLEGDSVVYINEKILEGETYSINLKSQLISKQEYTVFAFIMADNNVYKSTDETFYSGSLSD